MCIYEFGIGTGGIDQNPPLRSQLLQQINLASVFNWNFEFKISVNYHPKLQKESSSYLVVDDLQIPKLELNNLRYHPSLSTLI